MHRGSPSWRAEAIAASSHVVPRAPVAQPGERVGEGEVLEGVAAAPSLDHAVADLGHEAMHRVADHRADDDVERTAAQPGGGVLHAADEHDGQHEVGGDAGDDRSELAAGAVQRGHGDRHERDHRDAGVGAAERVAQERRGEEEEERRSERAVLALHEDDAEYADHDRRAVEQRIEGAPDRRHDEGGHERAREGGRSACHGTAPDGRGDPHTPLIGLSRRKWSAGGRFRAARGCRAASRGSCPRPGRRPRRGRRAPAPG